MDASTIAFAGTGDGSISPPKLIPAGNPGPMTGRGNNTWLLDGAEPTLVDAGIGMAAHIEALEGALAGRPLVRLLITHGHADHASGAPVLRARWPDLEVCKFTPPNEEGWQGLTEGQQVRAGDTTLTVIHTPGHALDHVCFWNPATRELFVGDMLHAGSTVMIPAGRGGGLRAYLSSLARLAAMSPVRAFPGHGPVIDRPTDLIEQYLEHRRMREAQVLDCLASGIVDAEAIVARIYPDLAPGLGAAARATVEAHLEKIAEDRK